MELVTAGRNNNKCLPEALAQTIKHVWEEKHNFLVPILLYQHDKPCSTKSPGHHLLPSPLACLWSGAPEGE